ncbi:hypothetical protein D3C85_1094630 [compost metagenome]
MYSNGPGQFKRILRKRTCTVFIYFIVFFTQTVFNILPDFFFNLNFAATICKGYLNATLANGCYFCCFPVVILLFAR